MLFNSWEFSLFLPVVFILYWYVFNRSLRLQNFLILIASYFFYGWWSWKFMILLMTSTFLDYLYGFGVASENKRKAKFFLWLSVINNLGILGVFKYYNFFAVEFQGLMSQLGVHVSPALLHVALPVGISFYTFHGMSYVFDIYRGRQKPVTNFVDYAVFVCFFPLLVAGPIERASHLLPQVQRRRTFDYRQAVQGCSLILWGMFKKVVVADTLSVAVDEIFKQYTHSSATTLIVGAIAFSFQIYGDFGGYSDIALGTAKLFGFELLSNFRFPYFSRDIAEFWRRWHISLSSWFRDYLYIPLGGSKEGKLKAVRNTFIVFLVSGFWHGASWTFIIWGFIHACGFLPLLLTDRNRTHVLDVVAQDRRWPNFTELRQMIGTFIFVTIAWVFFRARDITTAVAYLVRIVTDSFTHPQQYLHLPHYMALFGYIVVILAGDWYLRRDERNYEFPSIAIYVIGIVTAVYFLAGQSDHLQFIYFQF
ncbi:MAG: MBOAT family protein [Bacteroidetes bacterium]|nr:MBOAT family protein [Bacteroidota bacterium]